MRKRLKQALPMFLLISLCLGGCQSSDAAFSGTAVAAPTPTPTQETKMYAIGETWTVDGQWNMTINSVKPITLDTSNYLNIAACKVYYLITYTYENLGYPVVNNTGLQMIIDPEEFAATYYDSTGAEGYSTGIESRYPESIGKGTYCISDEVIGFDNAGPFTLEYQKYTGDEKVEAANFYLDPDAAPVDAKITTVSNDSIQSKNEFKTGETWTIDGYCAITVDSVTRTDQYPASNGIGSKPASVYAVTMTVENLGYTGDTDWRTNEPGLATYQIWSSQAVDSAGEYATTIDDTEDLDYTYASILKPGESRQHTINFGIDHPGSFKLIIDLSNYGESAGRIAVFDLGA